MPTILSRFDMIYIVKDVHDVKKDTVSIFIKLWGLQKIYKVFLQSLS